MTTFSGAPIWTPIVIDTGAGVEHRSYLRLDGKAWRCAGFRLGAICSHVIAPVDSFGMPRLVLWEEIRDHVREHGVGV